MISETGVADAIDESMRLIDAVGTTTRPDRREGVQVSPFR